MYFKVSSALLSALEIQAGHIPKLAGLYLENEFLKNVKQYKCIACCNVFSKTANFEERNDI